MTDREFDEVWPFQPPPLPPYVGDVIPPETLDLGEARGLVIGPDEILVIVFPGFVDPQQLDAHRARLREVLGNRFIAVMGDDVMLAKVRPDDWGQPAIRR